MTRSFIAYAIFGAEKINGFQLARLLGAIDARFARLDTKPWRHIGAGVALLLLLLLRWPLRALPVLLGGLGLLIYQIGIGEIFAKLGVGQHLW